MRPILIVEDEPAIADLIEMTLEPLGQPLIKAHTGNEAANLLESTLFDLILLDVMLPGVDGFTLMDYIAPTGTPVIFLTAKATVEDLLARVEGLLRHTGRRAATLQAFDAVIDPDNHIVTQNGTRVELTPREFDLLLALVRARGQLLYREALYERVWGLDSNAGPRTVDLHIHRLRKKLHWDHKIVTVPKVGYKLLP